MPLQRSLRRRISQAGCLVTIRSVIVPSRVGDPPLGADCKGFRSSSQRIVTVEACFLRIAASVYAGLRRQEEFCNQPHDRPVPYAELDMAIRIYGIEMAYRQRKAGV